LTDGDVSALVDALEDGLTVLDSGGAPVTVQPCDVRNSDFMALLQAYKQNRASFASRGRKG